MPAFLLPVLLQELLLVLLLSLCFASSFLLPVLFKELFLILCSTFGFTSLHTFSEAEAFQLDVKGLKVHLSLKLQAAGLVGHHVVLQLYFLLPTSRTLHLS